MNNLLINLIIAFKSLNNNKIRSALTILGIVIGISAVITIYSAGDSMKRYVLNEVEAFGSNIIQVEVKVPSTSKTSSDNSMGMAMGITITTLKESDAFAIRKLSNIKNNYASALGQAVVKYKNNNKTINIQGVNSSFIDIDKAEIELGRFFTEDENDARANVAILGASIAEKLFENESALDKIIKIKKESFRVIGITKKRGAAMFFDMDNIILIPIKTLQDKITGTNYVSFILSTMVDPNQQELTKLEIEDILRERHDIKTPDDDDFSVTTMDEMQEMIGTILNGLALLLTAIAATALVVGGVGIMNIMYVSVFERTYEIGLRKAVGASNKNILTQFLSEAIIITFLGGILGLILGTIFSFLISFVATKNGFYWPFIINVNGIIIAITFSTLVGLVFGLYPAKKASQLDPITALRKE